MLLSEWFEDEMKILALLLIKIKSKSYWDWYKLTISEIEFTIRSQSRANFKKFNSHRVSSLKIEPLPITDKNHSIKNYW